MRYEVPSSVVKGEQIALKLALFNPWMQDLEVHHHLLTLLLQQALSPFLLLQN